MDVVNLTEYIVKSLVVNKDDVSVKEFPTDEENTILIQVMINEEDMGRVIGKSGKTANSIRNLVQVSSSINDKRKVKINIENF